jgi:hypothetical protein
MAAKRLRINMISRRQSTLDGRHLDHEAVRRFEPLAHDVAPSHLNSMSDVEAEWLPRMKISER